MQTKISIIVPVYNVEKYLARCLDSIVNQTIKEIEIILVNDGSKDNSQKIIEEYAKNDERIVVINKENGGLSDARNTGLDIALGEYIAFIDSDDFVDVEMLNQMYALGKKHQADVVFCGLVKVNEYGREFKPMPQSTQLNEKIELEKDFTFFGEMGCFACNKIYKKELFAIHRFQKGLHFEDVELIPKLILDSKIVAKSDSLFYKYFERQDSISQSFTAKGTDIFVAIDQVTDYFINKKNNSNLKELKRFQILMGFYSYLAYVARVKDKELKINMLELLEIKMKEYNISKKEIIQYKRFDKNYLFSINPLKIIFYLFVLIHKKWITYF
jgi:glycosyltransferase involved in cell wall biosynthesis